MWLFITLLKPRAITFHATIKLLIQLLHHFVRILPFPQGSIDPLGSLGYGLPPFRGAYQGLTLNSGYILWVCSSQKAVGKGVKEEGLEEREIG